MKKLFSWPLSSKYSEARTIIIILIHSTHSATLTNKVPQLIKTIHQEKKKITKKHNQKNIKKLSNNPNKKPNKKTKASSNF